MSWICAAFNFPSNVCLTFSMRAGEIKHALRSNSAAEFSFIGLNGVVALPGQLFSVTSKMQLQFHFLWENDTDNDQLGIPI